MVNGLQDSISTTSFLASTSAGMTGELVVGGSQTGTEVGASADFSDGGLGVAASVEAGTKKRIGGESRKQQRTLAVLLVKFNHFFGGGRLLRAGRRVRPLAWLLDLLSASERNDWKEDGERTHFLVFGFSSIVASESASESSSSDGSSTGS